MEEPLDDRLCWEEALLGKIRAMSVLQKNVVLDTIHHCIKEDTQVGLWDTRLPLQDTPLCRSRAPWGPHCPSTPTGLCVHEAPDLPGCVAEGTRRQEGAGAQGEGQVGHRDLTSWCSVPGSLGWAWKPHGARHSLPPPLGLEGCRAQGGVRPSSEPGDLPTCGVQEASQLRPPAIEGGQALLFPDAPQVLAFCPVLTPEPPPVVAEVPGEVGLSWSLSSTFLLQVLWGLRADR